MADEPLICPSCGHGQDPSERFCPSCGMPLVHAKGADDERVGSLRRAARKVDPKYAEGEPVKVVGARNLSEAEFIQGLLLEEGIPSMLRRMRGFEVPDFLASGPRDVLVPAAGYAAAREVLLQSELVSDHAAPSAASASGWGLLAAGGWQVLVWLIAALAVVALVLAIVLGVSGSR